MFFNRPLGDEDISIGRTGTAALVHRGPDASGEWIDARKGVFIGHRRLSIIDLSSASAQPMERDGWVVAFNGEIYNFRSLRDHLEKEGTQFVSAGDTEVMLRSWQRWGEGALERFDGMFAFTVWDGEIAHVAVDPFGEKPLYWAETSDGVLISSELGPLAQVLSAKPDLSDKLLTAYMSLGFIPAPATAFRGIHRLTPATILAVRNGRVLWCRPYWAPPKGELGRGPVQPLSEAELDRIRDKLVGSLEDRLHADVPVCLFLSSGIDSALIAALLKHDLHKDLSCLTVAFPRGAVVNEAPQAREVARYLQCSHEIIESNEQQEGKGAQVVLDLFGEPNDNITVLSVLQMARIASCRYKVALTGMGGDEVFRGYGKHAYFYRWRHLYGIPESLRIALGTIARGLSGVYPRAHRFSALFGVHNWELYLAHKNYPTIEWLRRLPGFSSWAMATFPNDPADIDLAIPAFELTHVMPNSHLLALDLGSMRASLELRTPFLSRAVAQALAHFDPRTFTAFGQKSVLRRLLARYLPMEVVNRPKRGFVFPHDRFLHGLGDSMPIITEFPRDLVNLAWDRRGAGAGWQRLAVRLALFQEFMRRPHKGQGIWSSCA